MTDSIFLSLCMIVKNESANLPRCLERAKPYVDEIVIVDTGSTDNTCKIALQFNATLSHFQWCDDFAAARNYAIQQAKGQWILMLDADEELLVSSHEFRTQLISDSEILAYNLNLTDAHAPNSSVGGLFPRLFRNLPELRYTGKYHEYIVVSNEAIAQNYISNLDGVSILHHGYVPDTLKAKHLLRNIPLLERIKNQEKLDFMLLHALAEAYESIGELEKSQSCYEEALEELFPYLLSGDRPTQSRALPSWIYNLGTEALKQQDFDILVLLCQRGLEWYPNFPPLLHLAGASLAELGFGLGAVSYFKKCLQLGEEKSYFQGEPFPLDLITTHAAFNLGYTYMNLNLWQEAKEAFTLTKQFSPEHAIAQQYLEELATK